MTEEHRSKAEIAAEIIRGEQVSCTRFEYTHAIRVWLRQLATHWLNGNDITHAAAAMAEVQRLDEAFAYEHQDGRELAQ